LVIASLIETIASKKASVDVSFVSPADILLYFTKSTQQNKKARTKCGPQSGIMFR